LGIVTTLVDAAGAPGLSAASQGRMDPNAGEQPTTRDSPDPDRREITIPGLGQLATEKPRRDDGAEDLRSPAPDREHARVPHQVMGDAGPTPRTVDRSPRPGDIRER